MTIRMLLLSKSITDQPVMSLRTGGKVATAKAPIFNPDNLKIVGFHCEDSFSKEYLVLVSQDIRDHINQGFVVDDYDVLAQADDLIRLQKFIDIAFELPGKQVTTKQKKRLGKVVDYAVDSETLYVQKLYVGQSMLKSLSNGQLSVDRNQIIEVTDKHIVIKDPLQPTRVKPQTVPKPATS